MAKSWSLVTIFFISPKVSSTQGLLMINFTKKWKNIKGKIKVFVRSHTGQQTLMNANKWLLAAIDYRYKSVIAHMKRTYNSVLKNGKSRISNILGKQYNFIKCAGTYGTPKSCHRLKVQWHQNYNLS